MRGPREKDNSTTKSNGITPACAGTTKVFKKVRRPARDHPRMCGDHSLDYRCRSYFLGSPPHVRGPRYMSPLNRALPGITPACAGTTSSHWKQSSSVRDHPRMCGDHFENAYHIINYGGSPPHVRGPHRSSNSRPDTLGITPACAGTTI